MALPVVIPLPPVAVSSVPLTQADPLYFKTCPDDGDVTATSLKSFNAPPPPPVGASIQSTPDHVYFIICPEVP